jgi:hypothetical protein
MDHESFRMPEALEVQVWVIINDDAEPVRSSSRPGEMVRDALAAVINDEAHSSQGGETATDTKEGSRRRGAFWKKLERTTKRGRWSKS